MRRAVEALESQNLFVSVISIGEIAKGIALLKEAKKKDDLRVWMQALESHYADRVLAVDRETSHIVRDVVIRRLQNLSSDRFTMSDGYARS